MLEKIGRQHIAELELEVSTFNKLQNSGITLIEEFLKKPPVVLMVQGAITSKECLEIYSSINRLQNRVNGTFRSHRIDLGGPHNFDLISFD